MKFVYIHGQSYFWALYFVLLVCLCIPVVLNQDLIPPLPPGVVWQYLETFLAISAGGSGVLLVSNE